MLPPFWCSLKSIFGTPDENAPPPPVILTTGPMFNRILHKEVMASANRIIEVGGAAL